MASIFAGMGTGYVDNVRVQIRVGNGLRIALLPLQRRSEVVIATNEQVRNKQNKHGQM